MTERLVIRCNEEYKERVIKQAKKQGLTTTTFIKLLINEELKKLEKEKKG